MTYLVKNIFSKPLDPTVFPGWGSQAVSNHNQPPKTNCAICPGHVDEPDQKICANCRRRRRENPLHVLTELNQYTL